MTYMDLLEKKLVEIIQFYSDPLKEVIQQNKLKNIGGSKKRKRRRRA